MFRPINLRYKSAEGLGCRTLVQLMELEPCATDRVDNYKAMRQSWICLQASTQTVLNSQPQLRLVCLRICCITSIHIRPTPHYSTSRRPLVPISIATKHLSSELNPLLNVSITTSACLHTVDQSQRPATILRTSIKTTELAFLIFPQRCVIMYSTTVFFFVPKTANERS